MAGLLEGVKVLEMAVLLTGDYVGMLLADQGAEVIKIESPQGGDYLRVYMGALKPNWSPSHVFVNRNKRSLTLDVSKPEGKEVLRKLLDWADVFVTGNVADTVKKLGVDYDTLSKIKPGLVYCQATGFGAEGPFASLPSHGMMMNAVVGGTPVRIEEDGFAYLDKSKETPTSHGANGTFIGPIFAAYGVAAALVRKARTGKGAYIDISCSDSVLAAQWLPLNNGLNEGRITQSEVPSPTRETADYNYYHCKDGKGIIFCAQEQRFWESFCRAVNRPDWVDIKKRIGNGMPLRRELQKLFLTQPQAHWVDLFVQHRVAAGPVVDIKEISTQPHLRFREIVMESTHPVAGPFNMVTEPVRVRGEKFKLRYHAPSLGQHTDEVLAEFGYSKAQIADLRKKGAV